MKTRKPYPSDVSDEEWSFVVPYLALVREDSEQRRHELREVFNALRWLIRSGVRISVMVIGRFGERDQYGRWCCAVNG
ncbi:transposase, partial [Burkholderia ubonensis]|uniref:transposase n=1 Tax=Burkholderia ubonensis TaxID=101571 RepID=UPI001E45F37F